MVGQACSLLALVNPLQCLGDHGALGGSDLQEKMNEPCSWCCLLMHWMAYACVPTDSNAHQQKYHQGQSTDLQGQLLGLRLPHTLLFFISA